MKYLKTDHVYRIHERVIETTGGAPNVLHPDRVESAVEQPRLSFGGQELYPKLSDKAAVMAFTLCHDHPFQDGNKRTAHATMEMFLLRNGWEIVAPTDEQEAIFLAVAAGRMKLENFTSWVASKMRRRQTRGGSGHRKMRA